MTLRVSTPAHPEKMPRGVEVIREAREHAEEQRAGEAVIYPKSGRMEEELSSSSSSEEEEEEEEDDEEADE